MLAYIEPVECKNAEPIKEGYGRFNSGLVVPAWDGMLGILPNHAPMIVLIGLGKLTVEKLVDLSKHDYRLEPNVTITPDNKWVVFRSNMHGPTHVYAVEVAKQK